MIKFFRKIRYDLMEKNKTGKYLKYAIGEIILVVIGILIALQINNWNENRKNSIEEKLILESLLENLKVAKKQSESLILNENIMKTGLIQILGIEASNGKNISVAITDSIFNSKIWDLQSDKPTFNTYINLKNTNKLSLITDKKINNNFTDLEFSLNRLNDILEDRLNVHQIRIDDILENEINFIPLVKSNIPNVNIDNELPNDYDQILSNKRIRNLLGMKLTFTQDAINFRKNLDVEIENLILLIETELDN
jgi:hypothetical protein